MKFITPQTLAHLLKDASTAPKAGIQVLKLLPNPFFIESWLNSAVDVLEKYTPQAYLLPIKAHKHWFTQSIAFTDYDLSFEESQQQVNKYLESKESFELHESALKLVLGKGGLNHG